MHGIGRLSRRLVVLGLAAWGVVISFPVMSFGHPIIENAIDVVVAADRISIEARIAAEEVGLVDAGGNGPSDNPQWRAAVEKHAEYVSRHLHVWADGEELSGSACYVGQVDAAGAANNEDSEHDPSPLIRYQLEYRLATPPRRLEVSQDFLSDFAGWSAPCVLRVRSADRSSFEMSLLERGGRAPLPDPPLPTAPAASGGSIRTEINHWNTFGSYLRHGIEHILTGYDHLLFVAALVLAAGRFWELVKVVTAFTLAHTLTLAISVFNMFTLDASIVEPMIAASIVLVALQNVLFPERSQGRLRLAIAFGFGLFHGLGFAGGLKEVMSELPGAAIWLALIAFSLGVEIGHQIVVLPLFSAIAVAKRGQRDPAAAVRQRRVMQVASAAITAAGVYFLIESLRW